MEGTAKAKRAWAVSMIRILAVAAGAGVFAAYFLKYRQEYKLEDFIAPAVCLMLFIAAFIAAAPSIVRLICGEGDIPVPYKSKKEETRRDLILICVAALVIHFAAMLTGALIYKLVDGWGSSLPFLKLVRTAWMKSNTDVQHYLDIAEHWYVSEGNEALFIVFFPMFPLLVRGLNLIFHNSFLSALVLNAVAAVGAAAMTYLALLPALGRKRARAAAFIYLLLPGAIFMNSPMSEPVFMLFTACFFYFLNNKKYLLAGLFTALAGFTRSLGVLLAIPLAAVGIGDIVSRIKSKEPVLGVLLRLTAAGALSVTGTLAYLGINYAVHGDAFKFFEFQWSNWHQKACPFFDTPRYIVQRAASALNDPDKLLALWGPQLIAIFGSLILMTAAARKLPASHMLYFLPYFAVAIGCTWLLSSVRYLCAALPVAAAVALPCEKKGPKALIFALLIALYLLYMLMYMLRWGVY